MKRQWPVVVMSRQQTQYGWTVYFDRSPEPNAPWWVNSTLEGGRLSINVTDEENSAIAIGDRYLIGIENE